MKIATPEEIRAAQEAGRPEPEHVRAMLARVPPSWNLVDKGADGAAFQRGTIQVVMTLAKYEDHQLWIHTSLCGRVSREKFYLPTWEDVKRVKHDFIGNHWAYVVFPPENKYVNQNPYVLHLFARFDGESALPDFTRGLGTL